MSIKTLQISNLRNISQLSLEFGTSNNIIIGENGSGKSSVLEAIHFLGLGRSFRSHMAKRIIQYNQQNLSVFAKLYSNDAIGIEKTDSGLSTIRINGENQTSSAELANLLPLLLINPDSYQLLGSGPRFRRQFLDWGVFHVEQQFIHTWRRAHQATKQRNQCLKQGLSPNQVHAWNQELQAASEKLDQWRTQYISLFLPIFNSLITRFLDLPINLNYQRGWAKDKSLGQVLEDSYPRDKQLTYTQFGPHRADLQITHKKMPVFQLLSRGQQKLLLFALKLAQGIVLRDINQRRCIYLIDDLAAELDANKRSLVADVLAELEAQVFVTGIEEQALNSLIQRPNSEIFDVNTLIPALNDEIPA